MNGISYAACLVGVLAIASGCASTGQMNPTDKLPPPVVSKDLVETLDTAEEIDLDHAAMHATSAEIRAVDLPGEDYIVKKGDSLSTIAVKTGTTVESLAALNGISNPNRIRVGQRLVTSGDARAAAPAKSAPRRKVARSLSGDSYVVQAGDTLSEIAAAFGVTVAELKNANNLQGDKIRKGQKLVIKKAGTAEIQEPAEAPMTPAVSNEVQAVTEPPLIPEAPAAASVPAVQ